MCVILTIFYTFKCLLCVYLCVYPCPAFFLFSVITVFPPAAQQTCNITHYWTGARYCIPKTNLFLLLIHFSSDIALVIDCRSSLSQQDFSSVCTSSNGTLLSSPGGRARLTPALLAGWRRPGQRSAENLHGHTWAADPQVAEGSGVTLPFQRSSICPWPG